MYRTIAPDAVERRWKDMQRHRGAYIVPGPDYVWSIDGYLKLEPCGIEIYAGIDAYSRYIIWIYVGISGRTAVSVLSQYLIVIRTAGRHPLFLRSDHGSETPLIAGAHHQLHQAHNANIPLPQCYIYGTSTENVRIESWWGQLSKGLLFRWRVCQIFLSFFHLHCLLFSRTTSLTFEVEACSAKPQYPTRLRF